MAKSKNSFVKLQGIDVELERRGKGKPMLLLYGEEARELEMPFVDALAKDYEIFIPSAPGFGHTERPLWVENMDDIAYLYLDLLDELDLNGVTVMGFSLGGWIAAEMATKTCTRLERLILVDPYGIKVGGPEARDIADIYYLPPEKVMELKYFDAKFGERDFPSMADDVLEIIARNSESTARFVWEPYMHNPKLKRRLHRIKVPTLLVWGANDGIVTPDYGKAFCQSIPGAEIEIVPEAGHLPHLEQPEIFMNHVRNFLA